MQETISNIEKFIGYDRKNNDEKILLIKINVINNTNELFQD